VHREIKVPLGQKVPKVIPEPREIKVPKVPRERRA